MDLLRRNLFFIICGLVAAAGAALGFTGLRAMPKVVDEMENAKSLHDELDRLKSKPVNRAGIEREQERIDTTQDDLERIAKKAASLQKYEPLTEGTFPDGDDDARRRFQKSYAVEMQALFDELQSGQPPSQDEAKAWQTKIDNERLQARERALDAGAEPDSAIDTGPRETASGVLTTSGARSNAKARAAMSVAQKNYCYAVPIGVRTKSKVSSLDFLPALEDTGTVDAPEMFDVWMAQVGYWIQKDVVSAIVALNKEAAKDARGRGIDSWIGNMPVKDVIAIRIGRGYVLPEAGEFAGAPPGGFNEGLPPETGDTVFTGSVSTEQYDVMQFTVKLIMDQRDIPLFIDKLTSDTFYTVLRTAYQIAPPDLDMSGKIYGPEPNVNVIMDFEAVMLGDVFRTMMPYVVCETLADGGTGIACPEPEEDAEEE